ncbi:hypothetical protein CXB51_031058 [Gossypium anomalum]|uniref:Golgin candidate 4 n=1 Tax=Gossypium anomalum TaxID=47600 RepID=A0A8J6CM74_9ROSI|nr:hypothetical protein CXB51_031058 [Gossypium anomalum]
MWTSIANLKENLNKITLDVHGDDDEELEIYSSENGRHSAFSDRRNSQTFAHSKPVSCSPLASGIDSPFNSEVDVMLVNACLEQIFRLNQENGSLKQNLNATNAAPSAARSEISKVSNNGINALKVLESQLELLSEICWFIGKLRNSCNSLSSSGCHGNLNVEGKGDQSANRQHTSTSLVKNCYAGNQMSNGLSSKHDGKEKELADLLEEKTRSLEAIQASHGSQIKQFKMELEKEHDKLVNVQIRLQEEHKRNESFQEELKLLKSDEDKRSAELSKIRNESNKKTIEINCLQKELNRREDESSDDTMENMKRLVATLEKENTHLKMEKNELEAALESSKKASTDKIDPIPSENLKVDSSGSSPAKKEMELSLQKLEKDLKETCCERDKALQELTRLKQHLLEKASEESEKMDEDSKVIEELRERNEYQRAQVAHLEKALNMAMANQEEVKLMNNNEIQKSKEIIDNLNKKLTNCMRTIDAKDVELLNLQTALGQYYTGLEAKEHLERDLALATKESARLTGLLKDADEHAEFSKSEKEEILTKLSQTERMLAEGKTRVNKLEEDNGKLRRALEQSMTRLNRMSMDSDYLVDRRIVIKLLVTYFQRNHSKEVLDLMVRMRGFSDEDKQRMGVAQHGPGKGVIRGVLDLPGHLVGGILGGSPANTQANMAFDNQSIADMWIDFLLKETEEREKRESVEDVSRSREDLHGRSPEQTTAVSDVSRSSFSPSPLPSQGSFQQLEHSDSEFSTVLLTSPESSTRLSRLLPKY